MVLLLTGSLSWAQVRLLRGQIQLYMKRATFLRVYHTCMLCYMTHCFLLWFSGKYFFLFQYLRCCRYVWSCLLVAKLLFYLMWCKYKRPIEVCCPVSWPLQELWDRYGIFFFCFTYTKPCTTVGDKRCSNTTIGTGRPSLGGVLSLISSNGIVYL